MTYIRWFSEIGSGDVQEVGGKNASLGEMIRELADRDIEVPDGFALTSTAYWEFLQTNDLREEIGAHLEDLDSGFRSLASVGRSIRNLFAEATFPEAIASAVREAYGELESRYEREHVDVAVRSSATAEDLPEASFAGQQETFLNVSGADDVLAACLRCYASLFTDRAISYREKHGFRHLDVALSVGVQKMVRADRGSAGVCFSLDTETGFPDVVLVSAAWGLGESVVQGSVTPDQYTVFKPLLDRDDVVPIVGRTLGSKAIKMIYADDGSATRTVDTSEEERNGYVLSDEEILRLGRWTSIIEEHYGRPMDIEWAKDGETGRLFVVQARPETVQSRHTGGAIKTYTLEEKGKELCVGLSIGQAIATGPVCVLEDVADIDQFQDGSILVTEMTDPDWVPIMERAAGIITNSGGRTCHAAIVSRELGTPAIVGTGEATRVLQDGQEVTLSCAEGDEGFVYDGLLAYREEDVDLSDVPETRTRIMLNIGSPAAAFRFWRLPAEGVGLARMEFIVNNHIKIHPMALVHYDRLEDESAREEIARLTRGYADKTEYFVEHLARGVAKIAAAQWPEPVIVRMSDFKTNEYADLIGGEEFETPENNPMLGFRGASRYYSDRYRDGFALECRAIRRVREEIGLENVLIMIPFCRTLEEADRVLDVLAENGLERGRDGLEVYVMAEIPSNILLADGFAERFDGFSIGSNDLTQLVLGVDRDSSELAPLFDERNEAVKRAIRDLIRTAHDRGVKVGICGQAPSDYPDFAAFLVEAGIDSISLNPDSIVQAKQRVSEMEGELDRRGERKRSAGRPYRPAAAAAKSAGGS
ncbi:MAG: phosphoenolpyruvate synthase [Gemmatimonadota bacterium]|nr:phosphoenolpyruvate synthase [Gemmatimonadota bacterium]